MTAQTADQLRRQMLRVCAIVGGLLVVCVLGLGLHQSSPADSAAKWQRSYQAALEQRVNAPARALALAERSWQLAEATWGANHPNVAQSLELYAQLYEIAGPIEDRNRAGRALELQYRALGIRQEALSAGAPELAQSLRQIGALYEQQGSQDKALQFALRALVIDEEAYGNEHLAIVPDLARVAQVLINLGDDRRAQSYHERELAILFGAADGSRKDYHRRLFEISGLYRDRGDYAYSQFLLAGGLANAEQSIGPTDAQLAPLLRELAAVYQAGDQPELAQPLLHRLLAIDRQASGPERLQLPRSLVSLAQVKIALGEFAVAEELLIQAVEMANKFDDPYHTSLILALEELADLQQLSGRQESARELATHVSLLRQAPASRSIDSLSELALIVINFPLLVLSLFVFAGIRHSKGSATVWLWVGLLPHVLVIAWALLVGAGIPLMAAFLTAALVVLAKVRLVPVSPARSGTQPSADP